MVDVVNVEARVNATEGDLTVWWMRNGHPAEYWPVSGVEEATRLINVLSLEDLHNPDVTWNVGGLEVFEDGEWIEWEDEDGNTIDEVMDQRDGEDS